MKESKFQKGLYEVDFGLTCLFWEVYGGNEFYPLRENATLKDYKTHFAKLLTTIKFSFCDTCISTDKSHKEEIIELTDSEIVNIQKSKSIETLSSSLLTFFPKLCFLLIGRRLNNQSNRIKDNRAAWQINQHRQIHFTQTREQQFELLRQLLKDERIPGLKNYKTELSAYQVQKNKGEDMLDWFKRLHPDKYFKIFDRT